ncbi:MAG: flagellar biosynthesis anti-sigma factor FlgM [Bacteroidales bacterium]|nr:flagellar biosynthesis anti-sigma factor FlgM [Lachnoclostridium sp.]MCM1385211.1 flagellar biosynthesis anti-sigma factor FlgM [Lachnoclostridium sp.]MCM1466104.1 flagellar biosynthesis anti-sigma factor FlgM [Bacteroidales bacterium]
MRIEAYTQVQQIYQSQKVNQSKKANAGTRTNDQLEISSKGKDYQTAKAAVASAPDVREELTASIKAKIQSGSYSVDTNTFADKLLKKYEEMR